MSRVLSCLIITNCGACRQGDSAVEDEFPAVMRALNADLAVRLDKKWAVDQEMFRRVDHHAGGDKCMQVDVYAAAMNYCDLCHVYDAIQAIQWERGSVVQMVWNQEEDYGVHIKTVIGEVQTTLESSRFLSGEEVDRLPD